MQEILIMYGGFAFPLSIILSVFASEVGTFALINIHFPVKITGEPTRMSSFRSRIPALGNEMECLPKESVKSVERQQQHVADSSVSVQLMEVISASFRPRPPNVPHNELKL